MDIFNYLVSKNKIRNFLFISNTTLTSYNNFCMENINNNNIINSKDITHYYLEDKIENYSKFRKESDEINNNICKDKGVLKILEKHDIFYGNKPQNEDDKVDFNKIFKENFSGLCVDPKEEFIKKYKDELKTKLYNTYMTIMYHSPKLFYLINSAPYSPKHGDFLNNRNKFRNNFPANMPLRVRVIISFTKIYNEHIDEILDKICTTLNYKNLKKLSLFDVHQYIDLIIKEDIVSYYVSNREKLTNEKKIYSCIMLDVINLIDIFSYDNISELYENLNEKNTQIIHYIIKQIENMENKKENNIENKELDNEENNILNLEDDYPSDFYNNRLFDSKGNPLFKNNYEDCILNIGNINNVKDNQINSLNQYVIEGCNCLQEAGIDIFDKRIRNIIKLYIDTLNKKYPIRHFLRDIDRNKTLSFFINFISAKNIFKLDLSQINFLDGLNLFKYTIDNRNRHFFINRKTQRNGKESNVKTNNKNEFDEFVNIKKKKI